MLAHRLLQEIVGSSREPDRVDHSNTITLREDEWSLLLILRVLLLSVERFFFHGRHNDDVPPVGVREVRKADVLCQIWCPRAIIRP